MELTSILDSHPREDDEIVETEYNSHPQWQEMEFLCTHQSLLSLFFVKMCMELFKSSCYFTVEVKQTDLHVHEDAAAADQLVPL